MRPLSELPTSPMPRRTWRAALATYAHPATLALLLLGFAAGLPYMLVFSTLSVWLREAGVIRGATQRAVSGGDAGGADSPRRSP